jgi:hypothetical protein
MSRLKGMAGGMSLLLLFLGPFVSWCLGSLLSLFNPGVGTTVFFLGLVVSFALSVRLSISCLRHHTGGRVFAVITLLLAVVVVCSPLFSEAIAARLANDECERKFQKRPFVVSNFQPDLSDGAIHWGNLNRQVRGGFSAEVSIGLVRPPFQVRVRYHRDELNELN